MRVAPGVVNISVPGEPLAIDPRGLNASRQLSKEFPFNLDYNSGDTIGFSKPIAVSLPSIYIADWLKAGLNLQYVPDEIHEPDSSSEE